MRKGFLALLVALAFGAQVSLAQPSPSSPYQPIGLPSGEQPPSTALPDPTATVCASLAQPTAADDLPDFFWFRADYLMWWTKKGPVSVPLVTTGPTTDLVPGAINQPNTQLLFGNGSIDYGTTSGMRFDAGFWLDGAHCLSIEGNYLTLQRRSSHFAVAADAAGSPLITVPVFDAPGGPEDSFSTSFPGEQTGTSAVTTHSTLTGWELNLAGNVSSDCNLHFDLLGGFRALKLDEDLQFFNGFSPLQNDGFITFLGLPVGPPASVSTLDSFRTRNQFYGAQLGGRVEWTYGRINLSALGKVALGDNQQSVRIDGSSTLSVPGAATTTVAGGLLAQSSNSGRFTRDEFSVIPEVGIQVGYKVTEHLDAHVGYTFLYWNNVVRPGNQIDHVVEPALVPTGPDFGLPTLGARPAFQFRNTDYWAQGVNFGLNFHY